MRGDHRLPSGAAERERMAGALRRVRDELAGVEVTVESRDGLIRATAGARGELRALELDPRIYRNTNSAALAEAIIETVWAAADEAGREAFSLTADLLPPHATFEDTDLAFDPVLYRLERDETTNRR